MQSNNFLFLTVLFISFCSDCVSSSMYEVNICEILRFITIFLCCNCIFMWFHSYQGCVLEKLDFFIPCIHVMYILVLNFSRNFILWSRRFYVRSLQPILPPLKESSRIFSWQNNMYNCGSIVKLQRCRSQVAMLQTSCHNLFSTGKITESCFLENFVIFYLYVKNILRQFLTMCWFRLFKK